MIAQVLLGLATAVGAASLGALAAPRTMPARRPPPGDTRAPAPQPTERSRPPRRPRHRSGGGVSAADWAALLDTVSTQLRSGVSLIAAWSGALGERPLTGEAVTPGRPLKDTVETTTSDPDEAVVVQAVGAAMTLGGPMAATVDAAAALLREREAIRAEAAAHSAQARLSARVLTAVPLVFAGWSSASSPSFRHSLGTPIGLGCVAIGAALNLAGARWMRRIVAKAAR